MRYFHRNELLAYGLLAIAALVASLPLYPHQWHLLLHVGGVVVFLGNISVTAAWMLMAGRTKNRDVLHFAAKSVTRADLLFTLPGLLLVLLNGLAMAAARWGGWTGFHEISWITVSLMLFTISGLVWVGVLLRLQRRMLTLSGPSGRAGSPLPAEFFSALHQWYAWGTLATVLPIISLYLMVNKPTLW